MPDFGTPFSGLKSDRKLTDEEIIEVKDALIRRTEKIMSALDKYVTVDDLVNL